MPVRSKRNRKPNRAIGTARYATYLREWRQKNESYVRDREYRKRFGITLAEYEDLLKVQNGLCAICKQPCKRGRLAVDHNHATGEVRGLLCRLCNLILGMLEDNPEWLKTAEAYLAGKITSTAGLLGCPLWAGLDEAPWV